MIAHPKMKGLAQKEDGNVLFLILIAVALFAALSYAVTSSTRGQGSANSETNLISSAQITQYPSAVGTAVVRMIISGTTPEEIRFNRPAEYATLDSTDIGVFHPSGGGQAYIPAPADVMTGSTAGQWVFNAELEIPDIGISGAGGNDIIAYLVGIKQPICSKINEEHGMGTGIPVLNASRSTQYSMRMYDDGSNDYIFPFTDVPDIDDGSGSFNGQPFGCFQDAGGGEYVYYHVLVER